MDKALEALNVAARAIEKIKGITDVSFDNDNDSGEIFFFDEKEGKEFKLTLTEVED
jgi:hypothetical protein